MIIVHAVSRAKPERRAEHIVALLEVQRATNEHDDGCLHYRFVADLEDDCVFTCVEEWRDAASLRAHLNAPHIAQLRKTTAETALGPSEIRVFEGEPRPLP